MSAPSAEAAADEQGPQAPTPVALVPLGDSTTRLMAMLGRGLSVAAGLFSLLTLLVSWGYDTGFATGVTLLFVLVYLGVAGVGIFLANARVDFLSGVLGALIAGALLTRYSYGAGRVLLIIISTLLLFSATVVLLLAVTWVRPAGGKIKVSGFSASPGGQAGGAAPGGVAPGWYADPQVPGQMRYYDGAAWTEHVHQAQAPPAGPAEGQAQAPTTDG